MRHTSGNRAIVSRREKGQTAKNMRERNNVHNWSWSRQIQQLGPNLSCAGPPSPAHTCTYMHIHAHTCISHLDIFLLIKQKYMYIHGTYMHIHQDANMIQSDTCTYSDLNLNRDRCQVEGPWSSLTLADSLRVHSGYCQ